VGELVDVEPTEISLVSRAANRRKWLLYKSAEGGGDNVSYRLDDEEAQELFTDALNAPAEDEDRHLKALEKIAKDGETEVGDAERNALRGASRLLASVAEKLPDGAMRDVLAEAGLGHAAPQEKSGDEKPDDPEKTKEGDGVDKPEQKGAASEVPEEVREIAKAFDPIEGARLLESYRKNPDAVSLVLPMLKEQAARSKKSEDRLQKMEEERDEQAVRALMKQHGLPEDSEDAFALLKSMDEAQRTQFAEVLKPMEAKVAEATKLMTAEKGSGAPAKPSDAEAKIEKLAAEKIEKSETPLSKAEAFDQVLQEHPELYKEMDDKWRRDQLGVAATAGGED
jgi:hypothetical protein